MRLRNTRTVLEEVMPHWPMVRAVAGALLKEPDAPTQRSCNGDGASCLQTSPPARRSLKPPGVLRSPRPSKHLAPQRRRCSPLGQPRCSLATESRPPDRQLQPITPSVATLRPRLLKDPKSWRCRCLIREVSEEIHASPVEPCLLYQPS